MCINRDRTRNGDENKIDREWVEDKESPMGVTINEREDGIERVDHSGNLVFYGIVLGREHDHWFEFKTLWWKGDLKEMDLTEYKKENNSEILYKLFINFTKSA